MADPKAGDTTDSTSTTTTKTVGADDTADAGKSTTSADGTLVTDGADKGKGTDAKTDDVKTQAAPEKYEPFKMPEGFVADEVANKTFAEWAKTANLSQEAAQKAVDLYASMLTQQQKASQDSFEQMKKDWHDESVKMLGPNSKAEMAFISKGRDTFFDADAVQILKDSGLGNHPAIVRAFIKIGKAIADDTVVDGGKGGGGEKTAAEVLYPEQGKK